MPRRRQQRERFRESQWGGYASTLPRCRLVAAPGGVRRPAGSRHAASSSHYCRRRRRRRAERTVRLGSCRNGGYRRPRSRRPRTHARRCSWHCRGSRRGSERCRYFSPRHLARHRRLSYLCPGCPRDNGNRRVDLGVDDRAVTTEVPSECRIEEGLLHVVGRILIVDAKV